MILFNKLILNINLKNSYSVIFILSYDNMKLQLKMCIDILRNIIQINIFKKNGNSSCNRYKKYHKN